MKKVVAFFLTMIFPLEICACNKTVQNETSSVKNNVHESQIESSLPINADEKINEMATMQITINGREFEAELYDNEAAQQFKEMLPLQLDMEDLHDNEKFFYFSDDFNTADQEIIEIHEGDLLIYDSKCLVLFYENI